MVMSLSRPNLLAQLPLRRCIGGSVGKCGVPFTSRGRPSSLAKRFPTPQAEKEKELYDYEDVAPPAKQYAGEEYALDPERPTMVNPEEWAKYKIPHTFVGFNPKRLDIERLPRMRTDFDGKKGKLAWNGLECTKCGLQIRIEKRTNRETSLNIYAHENIPIEMLRSCPEKKVYPLLWRSRDPFLALDILGVDD